MVVEGQRYGHSAWRVIAAGLAFGQPAEVAYNSIDNADDNQAIENHGDAGSGTGRDHLRDNRENHAENGESDICKQTSLS